MSEAEQVSKPAPGHDPELFLIELPGDGGTRYLVTQTIITVDPERSVMGIPWKELAALFKREHDVLKAVAVPGQSKRGRRVSADVKIRYSVDKDSGSPNLEIDIGSAALYDSGNAA